MFRIAVFILLLFAITIGFAWLADNPGSVTVKWPWLQSVVEISLMQAVIAMAAIVTIIMLAWWVISAIIHSPAAFGRWRAGRRRDRGYNALSRGLIAAGSGNSAEARRLARESGKLLSDEPLVAMLDAQTSLLEGKRDEARKKFETMLDHDETKLLGLRGLFIEAEKEGESEAAAHFAKEANTQAPGTPWAAEAVLRALAANNAWEEALKTLETNRSSGLYEKPQYNRKRAVLLTALALKEEEGGDPDKAKAHALAANKLDPSLVPAAVVAGRVAARLGDVRKGAKVLEAAWKLEPHPEIAETYINLRSGDSALDHLKRAEALNSKRSYHVEGQFALAQTAMEAGEWKQARDAMESILRNQPTERACLMMADIEEAEHGDEGRMREWLARAVVAPRDATWTADGTTSDTWAPCSPVTGRIDAFQWKVPVEQIGGPIQDADDYSGLVHQPLEDKSAEADLEPAPQDDDNSSNQTMSAAAASAAVVMATDDKVDVEDDSDTVEDAIVIKEEEAVSEKVSQPNQDPGELETGVIDEEDKNSPYMNANLDADEDGLIDHRPDDPGVSNLQKEEKKSVFF